METVRRVRRVIKFIPKQYSDLIPDWLWKEAERAKPTFRFIAKSGRDGDPDLYDLEKAVTDAITAVGKHRANRYGEDLYGQAIPETLFFMLDSFEGRIALPAVRHWLKTVAPHLKR